MRQKKRFANFHHSIGVAPGHTDLPKASSQHETYLDTKLVWIGATMLQSRDGKSGQGLQKACAPTSTPKGQLSNSGIPP